MTTWGRQLLQIGRSISLRQQRKHKRKSLSLSLSLSLSHRSHRSKCHFELHIVAFSLSSLSSPHNTSQCSLCISLCFFRIFSIRLACSSTLAAWRSVCAVVSLRCVAVDQTRAWQREHCSATGSEQVLGRACVIGTSRCKGAGSKVVLDCCFFCRCVFNILVRKIISFDGCVCVWRSAWITWW